MIDPTKTIEFTANGLSHWAGMGDYRLVSPDKRLEVFIRYFGEPPHGDSYHELMVGGAKLPGFVWGCNFAFTADSQILAASWMSKLYERKTIVIELVEKRFCILPEYFYDFAFVERRLVCAGPINQGAYELDDCASWVVFTEAGRLA